MYTKPDEKVPDGLGTQRENHAKKKWPHYFFFFPDDFGLRSPVIQKPISPKKGVLLSIEARVLKQKINTYA